MTRFMTKVLAGALLALAMLSFSPTAMAIEEPPFVVVLQDDEFEVREYPRSSLQKSRWPALATAPPARAFGHWPISFSAATSPAKTSP